jgi:hypothetical protein
LLKGRRLAFRIALPLSPKPLVPQGEPRRVQRQGGRHGGGAFGWRRRHQSRGGGRPGRGHCGGQRRREEAGESAGGVGEAAQVGGVDGGGASGGRGA